MEQFRIQLRRINHLLQEVHRAHGPRSRLFLHRHQHSHRRNSLRVRLLRPFPSVQALRQLQSLLRMVRQVPLFSLPPSHLILSTVEPCHQASHRKPPRLLQRVQLYRVSKLLSMAWVTTFLLPMKILSTQCCLTPPLLSFSRTASSSEVRQ